MLSSLNKMLKSQILQQASSSSTPLGRLANKPEPNHKGNYNCIVLRSGKQLECPKGARVGMNGEKNHDVHNDVLHSKHEP